MGIAHENADDDYCGSQTTFETVMDYNCLDYEVLNGPMLWDACGVNHLYYDPNWGYSGC